MTWEPPHPYTDAPPPRWWKLTVPQVYGTPYFPVCWVRQIDTAEIGDWEEVSVVSPPLPAELPRYLQTAGNNVREAPNTHILNAEGKLEETSKNIIPSEKTANIVNKWVPIVGLHCDLTTKDHLWYQVRYQDPEAENFEAKKSNAVGWVRADVVKIFKGTLSPKEEENRAFPSDPDTIKPKTPAYTTPWAETASNRAVPTHFSRMSSPETPTLSRAVRSSRGGPRCRPSGTRCSSRTHAGAGCQPAR